MLVLCRYFQQRLQCCCPTHRVQLSDNYHHLHIVAAAAGALGSPNTLLLGTIWWRLLTQDFCCRTASLLPEGSERRRVQCAVVLTRCPAATGSNEFEASNRTFVLLLMCISLFTYEAVVAGGAVVLMWGICKCACSIFRFFKKDCELRQNGLRCDAVKMRICANGMKCVEWSRFAEIYHKMFVWDAFKTVVHVSSAIIHCVADVTAAHLCVTYINVSWQLSFPC